VKIAVCFVYTPCSLFAFKLGFGTWGQQELPSNRRGLLKEPSLGKLPEHFATKQIPMKSYKE
jgi:hypothetical protein